MTGCLAGSEANLFGSILCGGGGAQRRICTGGLCLGVA